MLETAGRHLTQHMDDNETAAVRFLCNISEEHSLHGMAVSGVRLLVSDNSCRSHTRSTSEYLKNESTYFHSQ